MAALNCCHFFVLAKLIRLREVNPPLRVVRDTSMISPLVHLHLAGEPGAMQGLIRLSGSSFNTILVKIDCS